ncbi:MAG: ABC transporter substrate-binding protein, partial [Thermomicrobiales bacterium]|nr:ABC transporter substrate-binding protein [Thermomicrobiales bacterium]
RSMFIRFDCEDPRLSDVRVRQAFNHAVDKDLLVSALLLGNGEVLDGQPIGRQIVGHNDELEAYPYDPDLARQLLEEAGFDFDEPLTMFGTVGRYTADQDITQAVAGMLGEVGVQIEVQPLEWGVWLTRYRDGTLTPLTFVGIHTSVPDAFTLLDTHSSASIGGKFKNPDFDAIMNEAASTIEPDARIELYNQASQLLRDEAGLLFLYQQYDIYAANHEVEGIDFRPDDAIDLVQAAPAS